MKKTVLGIITVAATFVFAGGNLSPVASAVAATGETCHVQRVYVDRDTDLMWQDAPYNDAEDGAYAKGYSVGKAGKWTYAKNYCLRLDYAGYTDWRLPTADELMAVHRKRGEAFHYFRDKDFWTSTPTTEGRYYVVYPADAYKYKRSKRQSNYIRCVRCTKK